MHKIFIRCLFVFRGEGVWNVSKFGLRGKTVNPPGQVTTPSQTFSLTVETKKARVHGSAWLYAQDCVYAFCILLISKSEFKKFAEYKESYLLSFCWQVSAGQSLRENWWKTHQKSRSLLMWKETNKFETPLLWKHFQESPSGAPLTPSESADFLRTTLHIQWSDAKCYLHTRKTVQAAFPSSAWCWTVGF